MGKRSLETDDENGCVKRLMVGHTLTDEEASNYCAFVGWERDRRISVFYRKAILEDKYILAFIQDSLISPRDKPEVHRFFDNGTWSEALQKGDHPYHWEMTGWITEFDILNTRTDDYFSASTFERSDPDLVKEYKSMCRHIWALLKENYVGHDLKFNPMKIFKTIPIQLTDM